LSLFLKLADVVAPIAATAGKKPAHLEEATKTNGALSAASCREGALVDVLKLRCWY